MKSRSGMKIMDLRRFLLALKVKFWHNLCAEPFRCAGLFLRVPSGRVAWLVDGVKEGFCDYLRSNERTRKAVGNENA